MIGIRAAAARLPEGRGSLGSGVLCASRDVEGDRVMK